MKPLAWIQATRPLAHANIAVPLLVGELLAWHLTGRWNLSLVVLTHLAGVFDQLFIVFANDVADEAGDRENDNSTPFSGGSRVLVEGKLSAHSLATASRIAAGGLLLLAAATAMIFERPLLFPAWVIAVALLWAYSYPPLRLSYRGGGALLQGIGLGVMLPLIGYYTVAGSFEDFMWPALVPLFGLGFAGNINTALPDAAADRRCGKATWPVRYGVSRARKHVLQLLALAVFMTPFVLRGASQQTWLLVEAGPAFILLFNATQWKSAEPKQRRACIRFVFANALALNLLMMGWCAAWMYNHHS